MKSLKILSIIGICICGLGSLVLMISEDCQEVQGFGIISALYGLAISIVLLVYINKNKNTKTIE